MHQDSNNCKNYWYVGDNSNKIINNNIQLNNQQLNNQQLNNQH